MQADDQAADHRHEDHRPSRAYSCPATSARAPAIGRGMEEIIEELGREIKQVREQADQPQQNQGDERTDSANDNGERDNPQQPHAGGEIAFLHHIETILLRQKRDEKGEERPPGQLAIRDLSREACRACDKAVELRHRCYPSRRAGAGKSGRRSEFTCGGGSSGAIIVLPLRQMGSMPDANSGAGLDGRERRRNNGRFVRQASTGRRRGVPTSRVGSLRRQD